MGRWGTKDVPLTNLRVLLMRPENKPNCRIAKASGVPSSRLSEYSLGRRSIPIHHILALCEALNVTPYELLGVVEDNVH